MDVQTQNAQSTGLFKNNTTIVLFDKTLLYKDKSYPKQKNSELDVKEDNLKRKKEIIRIVDGSFL
jgi:hypothetical protein